MKGATTYVESSFFFLIITDLLQYRNYSYMSGLHWLQEFQMYGPGLRPAPSINTWGGGVTGGRVRI